MAKTRAKKPKPLTFGDRLRIAREGAGLTPGELADIILADANGYRRWESGETTPRLAMLVPLAKACKVTVNYLLGQPD